ncbi:MAG: hypothetical protein AAFV88_18185 [Planctomycetota bacterium]
MNRQTRLRDSSLRFGFSADAIAMRTNHYSDPIFMDANQRTSRQPDGDAPTRSAGTKQSECVLQRHRT